VPKCNTPAKLTPSNTPTRLITSEDIRNKLLKAEERRQSLEMQKLTSITEKFQKIEEAAKSREEQNLQFSKQAEQKLLTKMESNKENRINLLNALKEKLKKTVRPFRNSFFLQILTCFYHYHYFFFKK